MPAPIPKDTGPIFNNNCNMIKKIIAWRLEGQGSTMRGEEIMIGCGYSLELVCCDFREFYYSPNWDFILHQACKQNKILSMDRWSNLEFLLT